MTDSWLGKFPITPYLIFPRKERENDNTFSLHSTSIPLFPILYGEKKKKRRNKKKDEIEKVNEKREKKGTASHDVSNV